MAKKSKSPKGEPPPFEKTVRTTSDAPNWQAERVSMIYSSFDDDGPWGFVALNSCVWREILKKLENFQTMTWGQVLAASGGRNHGTNNHDLSISGLTKAAKERIRHLEHEVDFICSLRLDGKLRVYGLRRGSQFAAMWVDPWHGENEKAVCPTRNG